MKKLLVFNFHNKSEGDEKREENIVNEIELNLPNSKFAKKLMYSEEYNEYIKKNGYHFTEKLAEYASKKLYNNVPYLQYVSKSQISELIESQKITISNKATLGDIIYATNSAYLNMYPEFIKDVKSCIMYANKLVNSKNSYEGIIFCHWNSDIIANNIDIDWHKYI